MDGGSGVFLGSVYSTLQFKTDGFAGGVAGAQRDLRGLGSSFTQAESQSSAFSNALGSGVRTGLLATGAAAVAAGVASIKMAGNFQQSLNVLRYNSGATAEQFELLSARARQLGQDAALPGISATDAANAMNELAKAGLSVNNVLEASKGVLSLAKAGNVDVGLAATTTARALNAFGLEGKQATRIADLLAAAANASTADIQDFAFGLQMVGAGSKQMGVSLADTVTALSIFSNAGISGSDAGTSLKTMFMALAKPMGGAGEKMKELGLRFFDAKGNFIGLSATAEQLRTKLSVLTVEQKNAALATIFGSDASRAAAILAENGAAGFEKMSIAVNKQGAAAKAAEAQNSGFNGALDNLKSTLETVGTDIGSRVLPGLTGFVEKLSAVIPVVGGFGVTAAREFGYGFTAGLNKVKGFAEVVTKRLQSGDYVGAGRAIVEGVVDGAKTATRGLADLFNTVKEKLGQYDWLDMGIELGGKVIPGLVLGIALGVANIDLGALFSGLRNNLGEVFGGIIALAFAPAKLIKPIVGALAKIPLAGRFLAWVVTGINTAGGRILSAVGNLVRSFATGFIDQLGIQGPRVIPAIVRFLSAIPERLGAATAGFYQAGLRIAETLGRGIAENGPRNIVLGMRALRENLINVSRTFAGGLYDVGRDAMAQLAVGMRVTFSGPLGALNTLRLRITGAVGDFGSLLFSKGIDLIAGLSSGISSGFGFVGTKLFELGRFIVGTTGGWLSPVFNRGLDILAWLGRGIDAGYSFIGSVIGSIGSRVVGAFSSFGSLLFNAGRSLVQGLLNGAGSLLGSVGSFFLNRLPGWIVGPFKKALGIHSPSTVFAGYGTNVVQGLASGIASSRGLVSSAMKGLDAQMTVTPTRPGLSLPSQAGLFGDQVQQPAAQRGGTSVNIERYEVHNNIDPERVIRDLSRRVALA